MNKIFIILFCVNITVFSNEVNNTPNISQKYNIHNSHDISKKGDMIKSELIKNEKNLKNNKKNPFIKIGVILCALGSLYLMLKIGLFTKIMDIINSFKKTNIQEKNEEDLRSDGKQKSQISENPNIHLNEGKLKKPITIFDNGFDGVMAGLLKKPHSEEVQNNFLNFLNEAMYPLYIALVYPPEEFKNRSVHDAVAYLHVNSVPRSKYSDYLKFIEDNIVEEQKKYRTVCVRCNNKQEFHSYGTACNNPNCVLPCFVLFK